MSDEVERVRIPDVGKEDVELVERLTGPVEFDKEKNGKFKRFQLTLRNYERQRQLDFWFADFCNNTLKCDPPIERSELQSLELETNNASLSEFGGRYGHDYVRPMLTLNMAEFQVFYERLTGKRGVAGCVIEGGVLESNHATQGLTLIISSGNTEFTHHELKHTVDFNLRKRQGKDKIIEEFVAFHEDVLSPRIIKQKTTWRSSTGEVERVEETEKVMSSDPRATGRKLKDAYFGQYESSFATEEEFHSHVDDVVDIVTRLSDHFSDEDLDRILLNATKVSELERLLELTEEAKD